MKILLGLVLLTIGFEVANGGKLLKKLNKQLGFKLEKIVAKNSANIASNAADLEANILDIKADISSNVDDISKNDAAISSNAALISNQDGRINTHQTDINNLYGLHNDNAASFTKPESQFRSTTCQPIKGVVPNENCMYIIDDMVMTEEQLLEAYGLVAMNGQPDPAKLWPDGEIPITFDSDISSAEQTFLWEVAARFNSDMNGCLSMIPLNGHTNYVKVIKDGGCWSQIGMVGNGEQELSLVGNLGGGGCWFERTVVHEFIHAFGFHHEQVRPDRDNYVEIIYENIPEDRVHNFNLFTGSLTFGVNYDGYSVMHYGSKAFSTNSYGNGNTIESKRPDLWTSAQLGTGSWMSQGDMSKLRKMYQCDKTCELECNGQPCNSDNTACDCQNGSSQSDCSALCPLDYPFAYLNGGYCCKTKEERPVELGITPQNQIVDGTCDGVDFNRQSKCCKDEAYSPCPHGSGCFDNVGIQKLFGCTDGSICKVGLKTDHNKYVVAEYNGKANANRDNLDAWEIFSVTFIGGDKVQFKGHHGKYLVAELDGTVNANRPQASTWETWTVENKGNGLAFKSYHENYLVAESNGELNANRTYASTWETFRIVHPDADPCELECNGQPCNSDNTACDCQNGSSQSDCSADPCVLDCNGQPCNSDNTACDCQNGSSQSDCSGPNCKDKQKTKKCIKWKKKGKCVKKKIAKKCKKTCNLC